MEKKDAEAIKKLKLSQTSEFISSSIGAGDGSMNDKRILTEIQKPSSVGVFSMNRE